MKDMYALSKLMEAAGVAFSTASAQTYTNYKHPSPQTMILKQHTAQQHKCYLKSHGITANLSFT